MSLNVTQNKTTDKQQLSSGKTDLSFILILFLILLHFPLLLLLNHQQSWVSKTHPGWGWMKMIESICPHDGRFVALADFRYVCVCVYMCVCVCLCVWVWVTPLQECADMKQQLSLEFPTSSRPSLLTASTDRSELKPSSTGSKCSTIRPRPQINLPLQ